MPQFRDLIDEISSISDNIKENLKPLVQKLADEIGKNLYRLDIQNISKISGIHNPTEKDVATIINVLRKKHGWAFGKSSLYLYIQPEYKTTIVTEHSQPERIDAILKDPERRAELEEKIKEAKRREQPAKPIITKARIEDMEKYTWDCWMAEELAMLAIKMEHDHKEKHEDKLCKDYSKRTKMVRDSRFATDINAYEAIIMAVNSTQSLKNAISGEWEFKTVWEVKDDEEKCRECIKDQCRNGKCKHECHRVVRPMTTKGLKYAIKTNDDLHALDKQIQRLSEIENDICKIGKILLENPKTKKLLQSAGVKKMLYNHIDRDECLQCDLYMEKFPNFFDSWK
jgi:hypothetical protein